MALTDNDKRVLSAIEKARELIAEAEGRLQDENEYEGECACFNADRQLIRRTAEILRNAGERITKYELMTRSERAHAHNDKFNGVCSGCGEHLETEADFAKHFVVSDWRYRNIGACDKEKVSTE